MAAENTKILTAEQEAQLLAPIDEHVGAIQEKINALRLNGTDKVLDIQNSLETLKRDRIYTAEEADREEGLKGDFTFVIESDGYTSFGDRAVRPLVQNFDASDYRFGRATHGYMPDYGPQPVFVAKGPAIREGVELGRGRVIDEAPTFAKIIGQPLPQADGKPIDEILK